MTEMVYIVLHNSHNICGIYKGNGIYHVVNYHKCLN